MVGLDSTPTHHSLTVNGPPWNVNSSHAEMLVNFWVVLTLGDGIVMVWECCENVVIPSSSLHQVWITMVGLVSSSTHQHSSTAIAPPPNRFDCPEMLDKPEVVLAHMDGMVGVLMPWESCVTLPIPPPTQEQAWVTTVRLVSTSTNHSWFLSFDCVEILDKTWVILAYSDDMMEGILMLREWCENIPITLTTSSLRQVWVTMVGLDSTSTHHSLTVNEPSHFSLGLNASQFLGCSNTCWWCCGAIIALWDCWATLS